MFDPKKENNSALCRICGRKTAHAVGQIEYFSGYAWTVSDCRCCGCRFTQHNERVHEQFHQSGATQYYREYKLLAASAKQKFDAADTRGLRELLCANAKYKFIIESLEGLPKTSRLLEFGCSRGYLTSFFILGGWDITGVDVSQDALAEARYLFGDAFEHVETPRIAAKAPYDAIYHVGTIGCVEDPVGLTRQQLSLLRPGGTLLFNAPNLEACQLRGQLWLDSAPPPDLVTLFRPGFWSKQFGDVAEVEEVELKASAQMNVLICLRQLFLTKWAPPIAAQGRLDDSPGTQNIHGLRSLLERGLVKLISTIKLDRLAPAKPQDFGLFVRMTKR